MGPVKTPTFIPNVNLTITNYIKPKYLSEDDLYKPVTIVSTEYSINNNKQFASEFFKI